MIGTRGQCLAVGRDENFFRDAVLQLCPCPIYWTFFPYDPTLERMSTLAEISHAVRSRRSEIGLTQARLAQLSGLSRATVAALENGSIANISVAKAESLLETMGLALGILYPKNKPHKAHMSALQQAAVTASVSYRGNLTPAILAAVLGGEPTPVAFQPHMRKLLNEAPISLLASVADEIQDSHGIGRKQTWAHMREMARDLRCSRALWS